MTLNQKRILELVSRGKLSAAEADKLIAAIKPKQEMLFKLEVSSSRQREPYFEFSVPVSKLSNFKALINILNSKGIKGRFRIGGFKLNLGNLNWQRIFELVQRGEQNELLIMEMPASENENITFTISVS